MRITEVRISLRDDLKLKAFVSITLDDCFVIRGLKVIKGQQGLFVSMPSRKREGENHRDIAHPVNNSTRKWMEDIVLEKYLLEVDRDPDAPMAAAAALPVPVIQLPAPPAWSIED